MTSDELNEKKGALLAQYNKAVEVVSMLKCELHQVGEGLVALGQHLLKEPLSVKRGDKAAYGDADTVFRYGRTNVAVDVDPVALAERLAVFHAAEAKKKQLEESLNGCNLSRYIQQ